MSERWRPYPKYKDSGVEWLREIPAYWEIRRLKYAAVVNSDVLPESTNPDHILQYVDIGNVDSTGNILDVKELRFENAPSRARRQAQPGDTIISTVRTYLKAIAFIGDPPDNLIVSTGFAVLRPRPGLEPKFLWRLVQSQGFVDAVVAHSEGVSYPAIAPTRLEELPVWIPPSEEQQAIVAFLDRETAKLDALVAKQERLIALLQERRAALISHAVTKGLDPNVPMRDSGIEWSGGEMPTHWTVQKLWTVAYLQRGHDLTTDERRPGDVPVYSSSGLSGYHDTVMANAPGVVTGRYGSIGKVFYTEDDYWPMNTALYVRNFWNSHPRFIYYLLQTLPFDAFSEKSAVPGIDRNDLHRLKVRRPPIEEQKAIAEFLDHQTEQLDKVCVRIHEAIERLQEYRTALISAAVTGKIDVRPAAQP